MFNFTQYFSAQRKYVSVQYDNTTQHNLRRWASAAGFDLTKTYNGGDQPEESFDFHTTIFYTTTRHVLPNGIINIGMKTARVSGFKMLGKENDIPVLSLEMDYDNPIGRIRKYYENVGLEDEWPFYQPHVSLSYAKQDPCPVPNHLPEFDLVFDSIVVRDILDDPT